MTDDLNNKRKKLIFRSWHRGTKEMDLLMGSFADQNLQSFDESALALYEDILNHNDPDLYNWISGREEPPANVRNQVFDALLEHKYASAS